MSATVEERLWSVSELATYLGVSRATVYRAMQEDALPFIPLSDRIKRFRREEVDAWLDGRLGGGRA